MRRVLRFGPVLLLAGTLVAAIGGDFEQARKLYNLTQFDQSLKVLLAIPEKNSQVYEWIGRNYYMQADYKKATEALETAVASASDDGEIALWLGRAYGRRAETSSPFTAPGHASRARQWFEKAVELSPRNSEALSDLFEYYLEAPGFLGGGLDKAEGIATRLGALDEAEGHWAAARLAEKRKEFGSAEAQLRRAIDLSPQRVGRIIDLAKFLARQGRIQEADQNMARAEKVAPNSPKVVYAKADLYIKTNRNLDLAKSLLKQYMNMKLSPDDPSRTDAARLLKQIEKS